MHPSLENCVHAAQEILALPDEQAFFDDLLPEWIRLAGDYTRHRVDWDAYTLEQKKEHSDSRSAAHNAFLEQTRIIARHSAQRGIQMPAFEALSTDRKTWGDLACMAAALVGIRNR
jgi:hypothetical protein